MCGSENYNKLKSDPTEVARINKRTLAYANNKYATDHEHADKCREKARIRTGNRYKNDEEYRMKDNSRKRHQRGFGNELFMLAMVAQDGRCAVCCRKFQDSRDAHADHCHDTGKPRGILCRSCNHTEGSIKQSGLSPVEFGHRMQDYITAPALSPDRLKKANYKRVSIRDILTTGI